MQSLRRGTFYGVKHRILMRLRLCGGVRGVPLRDDFYLNLLYRRAVWLRISNMRTVKVKPKLFLCNFTLQECNGYEAWCRNQVS